MIQKSLLLSFLICCSSIVHAQGLKIDDVKQIAHVDGYDAQRNFVGVNIFEGFATTAHLKIPVGFHITNNELTEIYVEHIEPESYTPHNLSSEQEKDILKDYVSLNDFKKDVKKSALAFLNHQ